MVSPLNNVAGGAELQAELGNRGGAYRKHFSPPPWRGAGEGLASASHPPDVHKLLTSGGHHGDVGSTNRTRKEKTHESAAWIRNRLGSGDPCGGRDRRRSRLQRWSVLSRDKLGGRGGARRLRARLWVRLRVLLDLPAAVPPLHLLRPIRPVGERVRPRRVVREGLRRPAVQARQLAPAGARHAGAQNR